MLDDVADDVVIDVGDVVDVVDGDDIKMNNKIMQVRNVLHDRSAPNPLQLASVDMPRSATPEQQQRPPTKTLCRTQAHHKMDFMKLVYTAFTVNLGLKHRKSHVEESHPVALPDWMWFGWNASFLPPNFLDTRLDTVGHAMDTLWTERERNPNLLQTEREREGEEPVEMEP
ncbi:hypothetical protein ACSBR1_033418 [Camellia fascicularis]